MFGKYSKMIGEALEDGIEGAGEVIGGALDNRGDTMKEAVNKTGEALGTGIDAVVDTTNDRIDFGSNVTSGLIRGGSKFFGDAIHSGTEVVNATVPFRPELSIPSMGPGVISPGMMPPGVSLPPSISMPSVSLPTVQRTATQLAERSINRLRKAPVEQVKEAISVVNALIKNKRLGSPSKMIAFLERKVRIGEVLPKNASSWSVETHQDFADAFRMDVKKKNVMDSVVDIAILNDEDLDDEIRAENISDASPSDLMRERRIVWQYPEPGTPLEPPYTVLVAVEHRDLAEAEKVVDRIIDSLSTRGGFRLPTSIANKVT